MSLNSVKDIYYLCNDRQRQEKLASLILYTKHMHKSITLNDIFNSNLVALYNLDKWTPSRKHGLQKIQFIHKIKCFIVQGFNLIHY